MLIHSTLYKKYYPFVRSISVQTLVDKDLEKLIEYIRDFPSWLNYWESRRSGNYNRRTENLSQECEYLIQQLEGRYALNLDGIAAINLVLYAHKYNWLLSLFIFPFTNFDFDRYTNILT